MLTFFNQSKLDYFSQVYIKTHTNKGKYEVNIKR